MRPIETENHLSKQALDAGQSLFNFNGERQALFPDDLLPPDLREAESLLTALASIFYPPEPLAEPLADESAHESADKSANTAAGQLSRTLIDQLAGAPDEERPGLQDTYRILVEQIPAVVFLAFFDKGIGEAYVSPQIEATLGFTQEEWLNDPVRWYQQIHPDDKARWSAEAAQMFLTGEPLRSVYRVLARDGAVIWFHCEVKMARHADGRPWFIHGVGFDLTELKQAEAALRDQAERMQVLSRRLLAVQEAERRRIALELHDEIGQILTGLKLKLEMSARQTEGAAHASLTEAQQLVNELMARTRQLSLDLRPATLDHLGLLPSLLQHTRQYTAQTQVRVDLRHGGLDGRRFTPELETAVFRIVQEALTNVARHAQAAEVQVFVWADQQSLMVQIEDHGQGFDVETALAAGQSSGLTGMRERALLLGGQFTVESHQGRGTRLMAEWNLADNADLQPHDAS